MPKRKYSDYKKSAYIKANKKQKPNPPARASVKGEMKYFDSELSATAIPASTGWTGTEFPPNVGTPTTLVVPVTGAAINQRIGRNILLHRLTVKGSIQVPVQTNETTADNGTQIRLALVQDMQTNAAQAQGEQIFQAPANVSALNAVNSFQSLANLGRFVVHKDKTIVLQNPNMTYDGTNVEQQGLIRNFKFSLSFNPPLPISFNATNGGTIADVVDKSFCIYANSTSTALGAQMIYNSRAYYKEQ